MPDKSNKQNSKEKKAWVCSVLMGFGHIRAAYPLKDIAYNGLLLYSEKGTTSAEEYKVWQKMLKIYYFLSKAEKIPVIGRLLFNLLNKASEIMPEYPRTDLSKPSIQVKYLNSVIKKQGLCQGLIKTIKEKNAPIISTYFALSIGIDLLAPEIKNNYCIVTDTDINRVWVPLQPSKTNIKYLVPSHTSHKRLLAYGVPEKNITYTGFPLPKENLGNENKLEILKKDLFNRLLRLDPKKNFFKINQKAVELYLGKKAPSSGKPGYITLMFAVGGAGAQYDLAEKIIGAMKEKIKTGKLRFILSVGTNKTAAEKFEKYIQAQGLSSYWEKEVRVICGSNMFDYMDRFNDAFHTLDVLWTKPSELSFYAGLAVPILIAPPIGKHEVFNKQWLLNMGAGIEMPGPIECCDEWLFDMLDEGRLADTAWNGFLKAPNSGTFIIEKLVKTGKA